MKQHLSGEDLVQLFHGAMILRSTAYYAKTEAKRSEEETLVNLDYLSQGAYLNPNNLPAQSQEQVARSSVDAHIKKVQAAQIDSQSNQELLKLQEKTSSFLKRSVEIKVLEPRDKPVEAIWFDPISGEYYPSQMNPKKIRGTIVEISLEKNLILLKPTLLYRLASKNRPFFAVSVIDPDSLSPFVDIQL